MKKYLSHFSAAKMWDIPYIEAVLGPETEETGPVDVTVCESNARFRNHGKKVHSCELDPPTPHPSNNKTYQYVFRLKTRGDAPPYWPPSHSFTGCKHRQGKGFCGLIQGCPRNEALNEIGCRDRISSADYERKALENVSR